MKNLYLAKSTKDRDTVGDVIIDLDKVLTVRLHNYIDYFVLSMDYTHDDAVCMRFATEEEARAEMKNLVDQWGGHGELVDDYNVMNKKSPQEKLDDFKQKLAKAILE